MGERGSGDRHRDVRAARESVETNKRLRDDLNRVPEKSHVKVKGSQGLVEVLDLRTQHRIDNEDELVNAIFNSLSSNSVFNFDFNKGKFVKKMIVYG